MTKRLETYKCDVCGNIVEVMHASGGTLTCCNQAMTLLVENTTDAAVEKHVPVVTAIDGGYKVAVGSVDHPMVDDHYIEWIELIAGDEVFLRHLNPGYAPVAVFLTAAADVHARAYCNLHGLWRSEG